MVQINKQAFKPYLIGFDMWLIAALYQIHITSLSLSLIKYIYILNDIYEYTCTLLLRNMAERRQQRTDQFIHLIMKAQSSVNPLVAVTLQGGVCSM